LFTGIIEETGRVKTVTERGEILVVAITARSILRGLRKGGSISVSGCCLTAVAVHRNGFVCELTQETLRRTAFERRLRPAALVNLERPLGAGGRFDGHIVQGHIDGIGRIVSLRRLGRSGSLVVASPPALRRYLVQKGSIAVDGVSLTVAELFRGSFTVALIPYTLERTSFRDAKAGDRVNLEVDVIAKYVERLLSSSGPGVQRGGSRFG